MSSNRVELLCGAMTVIYFDSFAHDNFTGIPQRDRTKQKAAIFSLCYYVQLCSRFVPLVRDTAAWMTLYNEDITTPGVATAGTLSTYLDRGWYVRRYLSYLTTCLNLSCRCFRLIPGAV